MDQTRPVFDPLEPLSPEEVCWVIDRSFACEVNDQINVHVLCFVFMACRATDGMAYWLHAFANHILVFTCPCTERH